MEKVKVLIIDSGVYANHSAFQKHIINGLTFDGGELYKSIDDINGHGTAVYGIISESETIADITCIRLKNIENGGSDKELIKLLEYIDSNMNFNVVNMSLGINKFDSELYNVCESLYNKGTIIVSAFDNIGCFSYPASFPFVIGVTSDNQCKNINEWIFHDDTVVQIGAFGGIQRLKWTDPPYVLMGGNSFACAHITRQVIGCYFDGIKKYNDVLEYLKCHAKQIICDPNINYILSENRPNISQAALFPVSKEMHALLRFSDLLEFDIAGVFDHKYSTNIKRSTNNIIEESNARNFIVQDITEIDWKEIDTIVLGHLKELLAYKQTNRIIKNLLCEAIALRKKIYSFDDLTQLLPQENYRYYYYPSVTSRNVPPIRYGKMYKIFTPVVGIFGTSSRQGKFTLQLYLRRIFKKRGYKVGQLGTEPHSLLFGLDAVYPMGYDTTVQINHIDQIRYLNYLMHYIDKQNNDIIFVGSQSGTINFDYNNINYYPIAQYCFLSGTLPDCVILCVNPYDDISYIRRTINYIEALACTKVIALVIFPKTVNEKWLAIPEARLPLSQEEYSRLKLLYHKELSLPAINLNDIEGIDQVCNMIENYFCEPEKSDI